MHTTARTTFFALLAMVLGALASSTHAEDAPAAASPKAAPMDFRKLKEWLPAELAGVKRTEASGERTQLGDFQLSTASGTYTKSADDENSPSIRVEVMDYSGAQAMGDMATAWKAVEIDRESDSGYEKTTKVGGFPAYEQFENDGSHGQLQVWVRNRFFVNVTSDHLPAEQFKKLGDQLPVAALGGS